ncbi:uncharacterized protein BX663DRAFT_520896 [Cokeromyces recurvatus]|uniref:uncharacterized protein n=1 Tax=Cokeromyces recurvatus TaxID=90255 RepID=UPI00221E97FB|nr:uncharacterized protein BX663DRAFT_520896 [Cokeromyces recurvatus]KAI7899662.1 hypothetical protein BX663DRAFT_520896 [Cokeromyces recurvatus]
MSTTIKEQISFPKALNIIRPSSPLIQRHDYSSSSTYSSSSPSTVSTLSNSSSNYNIRVQQPTTMINSSDFQNSYHYYYYSNNKPTTTTAAAVGSLIGVHRFLQRPRSNSSLSKSIPLFSDIVSDNENLDDSIDGLSSSDSENEMPSTTTTTTKKIVAKVKDGIIMNGKGEFVNKGRISEEQSAWLDEARANRKIADLEIEKSSLLVLNSTLEAKLKQQEVQIAELQKQLQQRNDRPLTPVSDNQVDELLLFNKNDSNFQTEEEKEIANDQVFQRIKLMLENLILQAQTALIQKSKQTGGRVLNEYNHKSEGANIASTLRRRGSDICSSSIKLVTKNSYRRSSPPVMITSPQRRSSSPRHLRQQDIEKPKWSF